jgi:hypothetical protein
VRVGGCEARHQSSSYNAVELGFQLPLPSKPSPPAPALSTASRVGPFEGSSAARFGHSVKPLLVLRALWAESRGYWRRLLVSPRCSERAALFQRTSLLGSEGEKLSLSNLGGLSASAVGMLL